MPELSIDALAPSGSKAWRLKTDEGWRTARFAEPLSPGDFTTEDPAVVRRWLAGRITRVRRDEITWSAAPERSMLAPGEVSLHAIVHRRQAPRLPEREALQKAIGEAQPGAHNVICLDLEGNFLVRDARTEPVIGDPAIAVHGDSLTTSTDIGPQAARNDQYVDRIYREFLATWERHLHSGRTNLYAGDGGWTPDLATLQQRLSTWHPPTHNG